MRDSSDPPSSGGDQLPSDPSSIQISYASIDSLVNFIKQVVSPQLEGTDKVNPSFEQLLCSETNKLSKFIVDPQTKCLQFQRICTDEAFLSSEEDYSYAILEEVSYFGPRTSSVLLNKYASHLEGDKPLKNQLNWIFLDDSDPYQLLHLYVSLDFAPYSRTLDRDDSERDGDASNPTVDKKISELGTALLHKLQNIKIPQVTLSINPDVAEMVKKCAAEGRKATVDDFGSKVEDSVFLNELQTGVNRWIKEIQKVTKMDRDVSSGTALQEIRFWLNLERALIHIQEQRDTLEVELTLDILKKGKRFHATISFDADTRLKEAFAKVNDYNPLMKDFPLDDLLSATDLEKIKQALKAIFNHLKKIRNTKYPVTRVLKLLEAISRDLINQLIKVLGTRKLMKIPYNEFERIANSCDEVFQTWFSEYEKVHGWLRDLVKKHKNEDLKLFLKVNLAHLKLENRIRQIRSFRTQHEQLRTVISRVMRPVTSSEKIDESVNSLSIEDGSDFSAIEEVHLAYELMKEVDDLDVSKEGTESWEAALKSYEDRINRVEARIAAKLRDQLGIAKNANEMFSIFSRFNALFFRPHIRGAIREYQTQLIQRVKEDIEALHQKFKVPFTQTKAFKMSKIRDIPPITANILWAKQVERKLSLYMRRVENVLGKGWETHVDGQKLKSDADSFRAKLNTFPIFDEWIQTVQDAIIRHWTITGKIFTIENTRSRSGKEVYKIRVNFKPEIIILSKEVRDLKYLQFRIPLPLLNKAHHVNTLYPFAVSLIEVIKSYEIAREKLEERPSLMLLLARTKKDVQMVLCESVTVLWESYKLNSYVKRLDDVVQSFQEKVDELVAVNEQIENEVRSLDTCPYSSIVFYEILQRIQKAVDDLSLHQYSNLNQWVEKLDEDVEKRLAARLQAGIRAWTAVLKGQSQDGDAIPDTDTPTTPGHKPGGDPNIAKLHHEFRITNQIMYISPSVEEARFSLFQQLFAWQNVVLLLNRIESSRYQVSLERSDTQRYKVLFKKMPDGLASVEEAYLAIEEKIDQMQKYVDQWLRYQSLWDLQSDMLYNHLGDDITKWMETLTEIKKSRAIFDTAESRQEIGPIVIDYAKVQSKVTLKYDSWHKEVLGKFGQLLGNEMSTMHALISKSRSELEQQPIDTANTKEVVTFITYLQSLKSKIRKWDKKVETFKEGQRLLERQRFQFPNSWLHVDNIEGEWSAFNEIMRRKDAAIQTQITSLQVKIVAEDKMVESRTVELLAEWEKNKPVEESLPPNEATSRLNIFETKFTLLKEDRDNVIKAKEALELIEPGATPLSANDEKLNVALEELQDLKSVWSELSKVWVQIDQLKELPWLSVQPRKLRQNLDNLMNQVKQIPTRYRQYSSYKFVQGLIQSYTKVNVIIIELKSDALKERHWKQLTKQLRVRWVLSELTLGQVWDVDLQANESIVRDVILVAQGEMALEEFLKQVREAWQNYELDLIRYHDQYCLIRGWDDLFNKVKEHINSITAMKLSPYYKEFEEDALAWEEKLNRINALFDIWIDVQRRWVYLEGIFSGSSDIKALLPSETTKFNSLSTDFLRQMKKVSASPLVMDVLNIQGIQKTMEKLVDQLTKIQKALGEYLERERSSFPRFYFVGDEDLLEIIGNAKNIPKLQKHFRKMFAGVSSILLNEDSTTVLGLSSKEGEEVIFFCPVSIKDHPKINQWLAMVEAEMRITLGKLLAQAVADMESFKDGIVQDKFMKWLDQFQTQIVVLAAQIGWSESIETALLTISNDPSTGMKPLEEALERVESTLTVLADSVLQEQPFLRRRKLEQLITEFVHKRDVTRSLLKKNIKSPKSFEWLNQMRFYFDPKHPNVLKQLSIIMANAKFNYGFEYLGVQDKLVQTPLTDRCYLTMTQALESRLGGSPFGPAGTGKTESVKALGNQLGRFVLVFNCDETFDFQAMGRIFVGLCQVGAWGCFDEFNRLEERMLSAVSQQIQMIQETLKSNQNQTGDNLKVELLGKQVRLEQDMAIFITMNPGYAGRSNLPDNLKKLFRSLAMNKPDRQLIAEVMLFSQGFRTAEKLANKIVPFFKLCGEQLSNQSHYDFGLRALKNVLVSAGNIKRDRIAKMKESMKLRNEEELEEARIAEKLPEQEILIQSVCETMVPKLVAEDIPLLFSLLSDVFPGIPYTRAEMAELKEHIAKVCAESYYVCGNESSSDHDSVWIEKVLQLYQISNLNHGLMMVGPSGSGKSSAWKILLKALERYDGIEGVAHVIDPKAISKEALYGTLDPNTREWTDGLFTHILRKIIDNIRGEINKRQWIIFDGDVDPEWVENLNSVLDDNKLLTLPNGERLSLPPNVRIMFEVEDLKFATLATVSRCGMIWFSEDVLTTEMIFENFFLRLTNVPFEEAEEELPMYGSKKRRGESDMASSDILSPSMQVQRDCVNILRPYFSPDGLVIRALEYAAAQEHIMDFTRLRALNSLFSMLNQVVKNVLNYNRTHHNFPIASEQLENYVSRSLIYSILWSFSGDAKLKSRCDLGEFLRSITTIPMPPNIQNLPIIDYEVSIEGRWVLWENKVPQIEVETHKVSAPDVVVPTLDTVRHESLLKTWLAEHNPLVLCGPPGSGKTMTLFSALRSLPDMEVVGLNFSSATSPELLLKTFDHYCEYRKTPNGVVLSPVQLGKWLILFCDEINLPDMDKYGTMRVISFLRQVVGQGGFYRTNDQAWIRLERIQFVGACNPPTDPGRKPLSHRFLRHVPVVYVDYPGETSLKQIYGTFNRAMFRMMPQFRNYAEPLTSAMVEFYLLSQEKFTQDMQPHYVYSPRELTRWVRGICEAIRPLNDLDIEGLVRLWAHEALRLFQDRLVEEEERIWTDKNVDEIALKHFPNIDKVKALSRPILYSNWTCKNYVPVDREELRKFTKERLKAFYEEELDVQLVLFNEVLDHVLRIDRIFRQPQGHVLLIGVSGAGKTTLSRFVAWMNGLSVFQIKVHNKYTAADFDDDLRSVLRRSGCKDEKIAFILDESNVLDSSFLERMNTLLANGEVPGLFEGDDLTTLMTQCKEASQRDGLMLDSNEELYRWFTGQVVKNLHVVFTMNPSSEGLKNRAATSPALFNRCVINWFGDWSDEALFQVGKEFTSKLDIDRPDYTPPEHFPVAFSGMPDTITHRLAIVNAFVYFHQTLHHANRRLLKRGNRITTITPRHYLDFINHYVKLFREKCSELEEEQLHLNVGLTKIRETVEQVEELRKSLALKTKELEAKNQAANAKLSQMFDDQQEAENKKVQSQSIQAQLKEQEDAIREKRESVMKDLAKVEPAVIEAQQAVKSIKRQHLVEVRSMSNPPLPVKMALESICLLLGEPVLDWKTIRSVIIRDNFIPTIVNFSAEDVSDDIRQKMTAKYLGNPDYNFEKVNRASLACGPLVKWAIAQLNYSTMLKQIEPLRNELTSLETEAENNKKKAAKIDAKIAQFEKSISAYKEEYANLVSQAQAIKTDLVSVQAKVDRSIALLKSLSSEKDRWEQSSETFRQQMQTIAGDVLLSASFLAYAGYFDQHYRQNLFNSWCTHLQQAGILFRSDLARTEYLSTADERLRWQANLLPTDDLCVENAIMLKRFNRYPLIIDPSGQATKFLLNEFESKKITKTSFLDDSFRKNLESALRFGNPLLVQDVENYDPILNPVLNREVRKTGGRVLITLGDQDIDLSPSFFIFLSTRDPTVEFSPDLCSRVTFVNFTVTRSSLQSQCLNQVLKAERPDIDQKRSDLLKLQGEFHLKLRQLEKSLLQALNDAKGRILDDDNVISTLEELKKEAGIICQKVEETDKVMAEVDAVSHQYMPLSQACSSIYFTLEGLNQVHFLYQYSLQFFLDIYSDCLLRNPNLPSVTDPNSRLSIITRDLFENVYKRVTRGMLHEDWIVFALLLCKIHLRGFSGEPNFETEFHHFLRGQEGILSGQPTISSNLLNADQLEKATALSKLPAFRSLQEKIDSCTEFEEWLKMSSAEDCVPKLWDSEKLLSEVGTAMHQLLITKSFRPDRLIAMAYKVVSHVLGSSFVQAANTELDMAHIVTKELKPSNPVLMCYVPGYDASNRVEDLSASLGIKPESIPIGSTEGFNRAEKVINSASKNGGWVILKNVHLAPQWLVQLEKKLHTLMAHPGFRLFLTFEINPKIPVNLLRAGRIFVFEPPPGIKANLLRTLNTIPPERMMRSPHERSRIYFLLSWFHAIVQERLRYCPLGWSKRYEFNESDLRVASDALDTWIDSVAMGRTNLPPEKVPWDAVRTLFGQCIYGGKIDNDFDQRLLTSFLEQLFTPKSFERDFSLVNNLNGFGSKSVITIPEGSGRQHYLSWIESLPDREEPSWLGLPDNAEKVLLTNQASDMVAKLLKLQLLEDDDDLVYVVEYENGHVMKRSSGDGRPAWMRTLLNSADAWLKLLPNNLQVLHRTVENIKDPLYRCFEREVTSASKLLDIVRHDLDDVIAICRAIKKQTNYHREMINNLAKGVIPDHWKRYTVPLGSTVIQWITDFSDRVKQLQNVSKSVMNEGSYALKKIHVWLGGLFNPEAYITATRQHVAQANGWSLEELDLEVEIADSDLSVSIDDNSFGITGLKLQGAESEKNKLFLSSAIMTELPLIRLKWIKCVEKDSKPKKLEVTLPVYLNSTRSDLLFTVKLSTGQDQNESAFYERGVAFISSTALG